jgi:subtilisin
MVGCGINKDHEDLANNVKGGVSFVEGKEWWEDKSNGHGTHCAGIVAAEYNDLGVVGVAPEASLYAVKILEEEGTIQALVEGINWCVDNDMDIISVSLVTGECEIVEQACENAYNNGLLIVATAGDANVASFVLWPANYSTVIAVGATDSNNQLWSGSPSGSEMEFVAPGVDVKSTVPGGYATHFGTSCSTPHVAGLAALIWSSPIDSSYDYDDDGEWDNNEVRKKLQDSAYDLGAAGRDEIYGFGLIDGLVATEYLDEEYTLTVTKSGSGTVSKIKTKTIAVSQLFDDGLFGVLLLPMLQLELRHHHQECGIYSLVKFMLMTNILLKEYS